ncbi:hypothetical protein BACCELL_04209 [Bacteroides cellulosilyticus DSM 14838]|uniref:Uncharacterized protein n=1 Tax=Bacteroides cellulosilyticus DSM 14838 TaxID=537012 RepID=E2NIS3_9BACE|nr:hypothetical protein BACCELL_04209 [Bacteroides cellulosilyticus DSM 14838]
MGVAQVDAEVGAAGGRDVDVKIWVGGGVSVGEGAEVATQLQSGGAEAGGVGAVAERPISV